MSSPTQRTLKLLRDSGYDPWVVEYWNPHSKTRLDLWNFGDIIAQKAGEPVLIVQTTSGSNTNARIKKILAENRARTWLLTDGRIEVHGWRKVKRGNRMLWEPRIVEITLDMFENAAESN